MNADEREFQRIEISPLKKVFCFTFLPFFVQTRLPTFHAPLLSAFISVH
jgi:hypothetical protein